MRHLVVALAMALLLVPSPAAGGGAAPFAFLASAGGGSVLAVDTSNGAVTPVPVGNPTYGVAVDSKGARAYVTDQSFSGKLYAIDVSTKTLVGAVAVGKQPYGVAVSSDGSRVYVANMLSHTVSVVDTAKIGVAGANPVVATLLAGRFPRGIAVSADGQIYVSNVSGSLVTAIDPATKALKQVPSAGGTPSGIALSPDGARLFVTEYGGTRLWVIDVAKIGGAGAIINTVTVGSAPYAVALNRDGTRAYVSNSGADTVSVIDTSHPGAEVLMDTVTVGTWPHGVAVASNGSRVYVVNNATFSISVIDVATNAVVTTVSLPSGSYPIAFGNFLAPIRMLSVKVDVVPDVVNLKKQGTVPVVIFGSDGSNGFDQFDVHTLSPADLLAIRLNGWSVKMKPNGEPMANYGDFNGDGLDDVMVHIDMSGTASAQAASGDSATLEGQTSDGMTFQGTDTVKFLH